MHLELDDKHNIMATHHDLDIYPEPEKVLYINEPGIADSTVYLQPTYDQEQPDNIRVYVPLNLNSDALIRRMTRLGRQYGYPTERNEFYYTLEVQQVITQLEIYDQVWYVREKDYADSPYANQHSQHGRELAEEILDILEQWEECSSAELFPIDQIDELEEEYGIIRDHHWK